jgi:hypothetical protein
MKSMNRHHLNSLLIAAALTTHASVVAATIEWNSPPRGIHLDSSGAAMSTDFVYELGVFSAGFQPVPSNVAQWLTHWNKADSVGRSKAANAFGSSFRVRNNTAPFTAGTKGWILGKKNSPTGTELILFRNNHWTWPAAEAAGAAPSLPREWSVDGKSTMDEVILGAVNPKGSPFVMQSTVVRSYGQWAELHQAYEVLADPNADSNGNGVPNLVEFAFDMDPRANNAPPATPVGQIDVAGAKHLKISIPRPGVNLADMRVEVSSDLKTWYQGPAFLEVVSDNQKEWIVRDKTPLSQTGGKRFMRLKVDLPK